MTICSRGQKNPLEFVFGTTEGCNGKRRGRNSIVLALHKERHHFELSLFLLTQNLHQTLLAMLLCKIWDLHWPCVLSPFSFYCIYTLIRLNMYVQMNVLLWFWLVKSNIKTSCLANVTNKESSVPCLSLTLEYKNFNVCMFGNFRKPITWDRWDNSEWLHEKG